MKKIKLFLAAIAAMVGLSANAWDGSAGKVYLQNVGSGLYWGAGDHLNWGTRAMLVKNPEYVTLSLADGVYKLESQVSNGGTAYYFNGDYMDNGSPVSLTITQSGDYWTIANGTTYYGYNGSESKAIKDNASGLTSDSEGAKWIIRTHDEMLADLANGTVANPKDATFLFLDPGFGRNNRNVGSWTVSDDCTNKNLNGANPNNYGCGESYHSTFTISQTAEVPNGVYKVSGRAFYRQDGSDNTHIPYLEANGQKSSFPLMNTGINSMKAAQESFMQGNWTIDPMIVEVTTGSLEIKMVCEQKTLWCILDGLELAYYGPITLADLPLDEAYVNSYNEALNAAQAYQSQDMFDADKTALNSVISANEFDASTKKQGELADVQTAIANLKAAAAAAAIAVEQYTRYTTAVSTINGGTNVDLTAIINNPSFESEAAGVLVSTGWTNEGAGMQGQTNTGFDGYKDGNVFAERWIASGHIEALKTYQKLTLPAGIYELSVVATFNGNGASMFVGDATTPITDPTTYKLLFKASDKEQVTFGIQAIDPTGSWLKADNFKLTYVGEDFPAYTLVTGKMSNVAAEAQNNAETTFNNNKTVINYNALLEAITAAQNSKEAYVKAANAIVEANALKDAHNFVTTEVATTFADAITEVQTKYNEGTLTDDEAKTGANLGTLATGHRAGANTAASNFMESTFGLTDFNAALCVNTWSLEGATDGSNFKIPFYEYWIADANSLGENKWTATLSSLENGLYSVTAWVRVRAKDGETATDATGITMDVNAGTAVDVTEGTQVGETQFQLKEYTAEGLVKDGTLTLNFNVAAENNISWLSFKNIKYTKVRDLTPEEMTVVPTGVTLDKNEVTLTATEPSVTLTPTFEPENATNTVTWTSSDVSVATVADGVVTAVAPGTATITVTSTLDATVTASATVTVVFPETEVPASDVVLDGPRKSTVTYGDNLIKNGAFEYPDSYYGWTNGAGGKLAAANFDIVTDGDNKYLRAKNSQGAGNANSISTGWPIESGKTYVFGYKIKANDNGNSQYHVVSLTNTIGTETAKISDDATPITTDWTDVKYKFTNTDGYAFVQFRARWLASNQSYDDFYLVEVTGEETVGNVQYALDAIPTANVGTGVFQYSQDAIDAANALVQGTATVEDVVNAYDALQVLNAPAAGQLYNIVVAEEGNAKKGNAIVIVPGATGANNPTGYGLNVNLTPNTNLNQAVTFTKVDGNNYNISFETTEGTTYITTGSLNGSAAGWKTQQIQATADAEKKCAFTIVASKEEDNVFYIYNPEHKDYIDYQDGGALYTDTNIDHKAFSLVETAKPSITINTTAAGWGTTILPFAVASLPTGVKAYSVSELSGNSSLTLVEVTALEANKPYIIEGAWNETLTGDAQGSALTYTEGLLTGTYTKIAAQDGWYIMQKQNGKVGFFLVDTQEAQPNVPANRAYLTISSPVKAFYFEDATDAIQNVFDGVAAGEIYDLAGRKVQNMQKGNVYIVNGKKVIVK